MTRPSEWNPAGGGSSAGGPDRPRRGAGSRWRTFAGRYGWRAYALPLLTVVSVVAIFNLGTRQDGPAARAAASASLPPASAAATSQSSRPTAAPSSKPPTTKPAASKLATSKPVLSSAAPSLPSTALPPGPAYSTSGQGSFSTIPGSSDVIGSGRLHRFTIDAEDGVSGADLNTFAATVMAALSDRRSWIATGSIALQRVQSGPVDFRISLTAPLTVRNLCGYSLRIETSCYAGSAGRVVLNVSRWVRGAQVYNGDLSEYRRYVVNHEVGHALGHNHAHYCLDNGQAPVMMQQTIGTKTEGGQVCRANSWPFPPGVAGTPGAEQVGDEVDMAFFRRNS